MGPWARVRVSDMTFWGERRSCNFDWGDPFRVEKHAGCFLLPLLERK